VLDRSIRVPAPHVSSVAFAGPDLDTLVITTATQDLTEEQLTASPLSGKLFTARPGVRGLPVPPWSGVAENQKETP
jgi:sugar lactone lactonase YvrE